MSTRQLRGSQYWSDSTMKIPRETCEEARMARFYLLW